MQGSATTAMREHRRAVKAREQSRAVTLTQVALRRRNPKGGRHVNAGRAAVLYCRGSASGGRVAGGGSNAMELRVATSWNGRRMQSAGHDARIHFSAAC
jgi:hypothetical protein